jgi:hypothetical protein
MEPRPIRDDFVAESAYSASSDLEQSPKFLVERKEVADLLVAEICSNGGPQPKRRHAEKLATDLKEAAEGSVLCLYADSEPGKDMIVQWCVPVRHRVDGDRFKTRVLVGCTVLATFHRGSRESLGHAWEAMFDYIEGNNIQVGGPRREIYHKSHTSARSPGPIELQVPLAAMNYRSDH